ncbi:glycosyltransferase family 2 protein [Carboxylicivirga linearis]|uniref:Glycosyltransferase family 2 protein n=1 Tax=Carboxylicivirga linearis TaxID=1628157 RepID=A0ABS5JVY2_9BACT|nr:glycosyltransferase family 2 protein [Carboxylicivirga linearis]MBS2099066.1 glycosyltransferase family 2 protein [Carboxylicivirga linearis]
MKSKYFVSVIMPIRNEAEGIEHTLKTLLEQDYPQNRMEIIIADGQSDDGTIEIVKAFASQYPLIKLINNEQRIVPTGLNKAINISNGEVIIRVDAHSVYPQNYISRLVEALDEYQADNVGCVIETIPYNNTSLSKAIAIALSSPFGVGNSSFRVGVEKPVEVDTVPFGCFRRDVFDQVGLFDEDLVRNQDDEFNARMRKNGKKILLIPDLKCQYTARKNLKQLRRMLFQYGLFKPLVNYKLKEVSTLRQLVPLLLIIYTVLGFVLSFIHPLIAVLYTIGLMFYLIALLMVSLVQALKHSKILSMWFYLFLSYPSMHYSYGWGYIVGLRKLLTGCKKSVEFTISR